MERWIYHQEEYKGYTIRIVEDPSPHNPREDCDNFGTMICFHRRYSLGDKHNFTRLELCDMAFGKDYVAVPVFLYDHSGLALDYRSFIGRAQHAEWDSGKIGYNVVSYDKIRQEFNRKRISKKLLKKAKEILQAEVELYGYYISGRCYGYEIVDADGDVQESCWGFMGQNVMNSIMDEAKGQIDWLCESGKTFSLDT